MCIKAQNEALNDSAIPVSRQYHPISFNLTKAKTFAAIVEIKAVGEINAVSNIYLESIQKVERTDHSLKMDVWAYKSNVLRSSQLQTSNRSKEVKCIYYCFEHLIFSR